MAASTTIAFRIVPPLYDLHWAMLRIRLQANDGPLIADVRVTLVASGADTPFDIVNDSGGGVAVLGDNFGWFHNTRFDVTVPGYLENSNQQMRRLAVGVANAIIDAYRVSSGRSSVRRVPLQHVGYLEIVRGDRQTTFSAFAGLVPGDPVSSEPRVDDDLVRAMQERLDGSGTPLWARLFADAEAELSAGDAYSALLLITNCLEVFVNHALRFVGRGRTDEAEIMQLVEAESIFSRAMKLHEMVSPEVSKTWLRQRVGKVWQDRNPVVHGRPLTLTEARAREALSAFLDIQTVMVPAIRAVGADATADLTVDPDGEGAPPLSDNLQ